MMPYTPTIFDRLSYSSLIISVIIIALDGRKSLFIRRAMPTSHQLADILHSSATGGLISALLVLMQCAAIYLILIENPTLDLIRKSLQRIAEACDHRYRLLPELIRDQKNIGPRLAHPR
jgi:hypothetical protein